MLPLLSMLLLLATGVCPSCVNTPPCGGIFVVVYIVPLGAQKQTSYDNRLLSSRRWFSGSDVLLFKNRREFPVSTIYPQIVGIAVVNTFSLPAVTMVFGASSFLKSLMLSYSRLGSRSLPNERSDAPLSTINACL